VLAPVPPSVRATSVPPTKYPPALAMFVAFVTSAKSSIPASLTLCVSVNAAVVFARNVLNA